MSERKVTTAYILEYSKSDMICETWRNRDKYII